MLEWVIYNFKPKEIKRYEKHGITSARLDLTEVKPKSNRCSINLTDLNRIRRPRFYWVIQKPGAPKVIFAAENTKKNISVNAIELPEGEICKFIISYPYHPSPNHSIGYESYSVDFLMQTPN